MAGCLIQVTVMCAVIGHVDRFVGNGTVIKDVAAVALAARDRLRLVAKSVPLQ